MDGCNSYVFSKGKCSRHSDVSKKIKQGKPKEKDTYYEYFKYHLEKCKRSENSGQIITEPTKSNICHILPKSSHPSVGNNKNNFVYLTFSEHERFDQLIFSHRFEDIEIEYPKLVPILVSRLSEVLPVCKENTLLKNKIEKWIEKLK